VRATTIRFPSDLWEQLEREARRQGISTAQYVRDAALYRVAFTAGAASSAGAAEGERIWRPPAEPAPEPK
jgi:Ribbon-helix-helix protein, copG family